MKELINNAKFIKFKTIFTILTTFIFALYNGIIGIIYKTYWNLAIFIYYMLLLFLKILLIGYDLKLKDDDLDKRKVVYIFSFIFLLLLNLSLIGPGIILITNNRSVHADKISSISIATYVFINLIFCIINLKKSKNNQNILKKQLTLIYFINSIVSIMVLQNTLINVNGVFEGSVYVLAIITTFSLIFLLLLLSIVSFIKNIKSNERNKNVSSTDI